MLRTVQGGPTDVWNDSCAVDQLEYAVARGATGATSNPTIVLDVLVARRGYWLPRIRELADANPTWTEVDLTWAIVEQMAVRGAAVLAPVFERDGRSHRPDVAPDRSDRRTATRTDARPGSPVHRLAPNMQVKFPNTRAGIAAIEEATAEGIHINATVASPFPRRSPSAEAVERGLDAFAAAGGDADAMTPVITLMMGRLDDWLRVIVERDEIALHPDALDWAGIAAFKRAYALFRERGYRARLLAAAYRHRLHWTELVGGDVA